MNIFENMHVACPHLENTFRQIQTNITGVVELNGHTMGYL